jgi:hypothetical protein
MDISDTVVKFIDIIQMNLANFAVFTKTKTCLTCLNLTVSETKVMIP